MICSLSSISVRMTSQSHLFSTGRSTRLAPIVHGQLKPLGMDAVDEGQVLNYSDRGWNRCEVWTRVFA